MRNYQRLLALALALALCVGMLAGCAKKGEKDPGTPSKPSDNNPGTPASNVSNEEKAAITAKYAYKASYVDVQGSFQYINSICISGSTVYLLAAVNGEEVTETDPYTGESYTYQQSRMGLFKVDAGTGAVEELTGYTPAQPPEGWQGGSDISSMQAASDGTLWLSVYYYTYRYNLPEDFDPENDQQWNYYEEGENKSTLVHLAADGSLIKEISTSFGSDSDGVATDVVGVDGNISNFLLDSAGNLYATDYNNIYVLDSEGTVQFQLPCDSNGGNLCRYSADKIGVITWGSGETDEDSGQFIRIIDPAKKGWSDEKIKIPGEAWNVYAGDDVYDLYYDYNGKIFGYIAATNTKEKVVDWMECDVDSNNLSSFSILPDGRVFALTTNYDYSGNGDRQTQLVVLTRVDASTVTEKTVITLACMYLDWDLRSRIVEYNKTNEKYRIVVKDYSEYATDEDYNAGVTKLNTEILAGKVPDLFFINSNIPLKKYAGKGLIADLYSFMDADPQHGREVFVQPVLKALENDGKLYEIGLNFSVSTAMGLQKVVGDYTTWTLADLRDAMTKLQPEATVFSFYNTKADMLSTCVSRNIKSYVDWTTGACNFDSDSFIAQLEFANSFLDSFDWETFYEENPNYNWEPDSDKMNRGEQLLTAVYLGSFDDYLYNCSAYDSGVCFVGYPTEDGSFGSSFQINYSYAISNVASDEVKNACWEFICSMLDEQNANTDRIWQFPILQKAFDAMKERAMTPDYQLDENGEKVLDENGEPIKYPKMTYYTGNSDEPTEIYEMTQEQADEVMDLINRTTSTSDYDQEIMDIITDEAQAFFAGEKTAQETAGMIQSRVNLYVAEQR